MPEYLSERWLEAPVDPAAEALAILAPTLAARIGRVVTGAPDGDARFTATLDAGSVTYEPGADDSVDVSLTDTFAHATAMLAGESDPNALFMRGQTKVAGDTRLLLDLLAATKTAAYAEIRDQVRADSTR